MLQRREHLQLAVQQLGWSTGFLLQTAPSTLFLGAFRFVLLARRFHCPVCCEERYLRVGVWLPASLPVFILLLLTGRWCLMAPLAPAIRAGSLVACMPELHTGCVQGQCILTDLQTRFYTQPLPSCAHFWPLFCQQPLATLAR